MHQVAMESFKMNFSNGSNFTFDSSGFEDMYFSFDPDLSTKRTATIVLICIYVPVFLLAVVGNVFVLLVIMLNPRMRNSAANYFLVNLAIADILVAVCCIPMTVTEMVYKVWIFGEILCKLAVYMQGVYIGASVLTIVCMGIDRYFAIRHPMIHRSVFSVGKVKVVIGLSWLLAAGVMLPLAIVRELQVHAIDDTFSLKYCMEQWPSPQDRQIYDIFLLFFIYIIPGGIIVLLYALIGCKLWRRDARLQRQNSCMNNEAKVMLSRRRLAMMMIVISVLFAVCWLPYYIFSIIMDFEPPFSATLIDLYPFALLLGHTNSAQNPILYCFMHRGFKKCILKILKCQCSSIRHERHTSISSRNSQINSRSRNSALTPMLRKEALKSSLSNDI